MGRIEDLIETIRESGEDLEFYGPQSEESIAILEDALGIKMPPSFVEFLRTYGGGGVTDSDISGIYGDKPLMPNQGCVYGDTVRWREEYGLPENLVIIRVEDEEEALCLDAGSPDSAGEYPVVRVDLFGGGVAKVGDPLKANSSFREFFEEYLEMWAEEGS